MRLIRRSFAALLGIALIILLLGPGCATKRMWSHLGYEAKQAMSATQIEGKHFSSIILFANNSYYEVEFPGIRGHGQVIGPADPPAQMPASKTIPLVGPSPALEVHIGRGEIKVQENGQYKAEYYCPRVDGSSDLAMIGFVLATPFTALADVFWTPALWLFETLQKGRH